MRQNRSLWRIFAGPVVIGVLGMAGLFGALAVDGPGDLLASLAIAGSLVAVGWALARR